MGKYVITHHAKAAPFNGSELPQADYSYLRSAFFLRKHTSDSGLTLVCFGSSPRTRTALERFIRSESHHIPSSEPFALFDIIMQGVFEDVDQNVWNLADVFGPLEHVSQSLIHCPSGRRNPILQQARE